MRNNRLIGSCMSKKHPYNRKSSRVMKRAVDTFERLTEALRKKIDALSDKTGEPAADPAHLTKQIVAHQGAWKMVQDALKKFREDDIEKGGVGKDGIDFGQAKEEVFRRIARLVARGAGREVS